MGTKAGLGVLCQGGCDAGGMWYCGTRMGTLCPSCPWDTRAGDAVFELCQGPFAVTPSWGHCPGTLCHSPGLGPLCHGTRRVTLCLGTLCHGTGLGNLCLSHAQCHRTILRYCVQDSVLWHGAGGHTGDPVPRQCHTGKPVPWHQAGNPVLEACPQVVPCWGHVTEPGWVSHWGPCPQAGLMTQCQRACPQVGLGWQ